MRFRFTKNVTNVENSSCIEKKIHPKVINISSKVILLKFVYVEHCCHTNKKAADMPQITNPHLCNITLPVVNSKFSWNMLVTF